MHVAAMCQNQISTERRMQPVRERRRAAEKGGCALQTRHQSLCLLQKSPHFAIFLVIDRLNAQRIHCTELAGSLIDEDGLRVVSLKRLTALTAQMGDVPDPVEPQNDGDELDDECDDCILIL